jgi:hypothetical protein
MWRTVTRRLSTTQAETRARLNQLLASATKTTAYEELMESPSPPPAVPRKADSVIPSTEWQAFPHRRTADTEALTESEQQGDYTRWMEMQASITHTQLDAHAVHTTLTSNSSYSLADKNTLVDRIQHVLKPQ